MPHLTPSISDTPSVVGGRAKVRQIKSSCIIVAQQSASRTSTFQASDKLYRSCSKCDDLIETHVVVVDGVFAEDGSVLVGINTNFGDPAAITNTCAGNVKTVCQQFNGNGIRDKTTKLGSGPFTVCIFTNADVLA